MSNSNVTAFIFQNSDMSKQQATDVWNGLRGGICEIQNGNASTLRFEELYRNAYTLVLHKHGDVLYKGVKTTIEGKLASTVTDVRKTTDNQILEAIVEKWKHHKLTMTMIRDILMYMDKTYCEIKRKMDSYNLGVLSFKGMVVMDLHVLPRMRIQILDNIKREREGEKIDGALIRNILRMLVDLGEPKNTSELYDIEFQKHFIQETTQFYRNESEIYIAENTVPDYLEKAERRLRAEQQRAESYLPKHETRQLLISTVENELIGRYKEHLVDNEKTGVADMFRKKKIKDLQRMYDLLLRVDAENVYLKNAMYTFIKDSGTSIVSDEENLKNPEKFVVEVLQLREKFSDIVTQSFRDDKHFLRSLKEAFEYFINLDMRAAKFLSQFADSLLKKYCLKLQEREVMKRMQDIITIFKYLSDKDIFEDFYKQHLAQRLLHGRTTDYSYETSMIGLLKSECGHQFTSKLEGMFKDIDQSRQLNEQWIQHTSTSDYKNDIELDTKVLTTGYWPFPSRDGCNLPMDLRNQCDRFMAFYCNAHSGRKLMFDTTRGQAELQADFDAGSKQLVVHTYQMCILVLYNGIDTLTWKQIKIATGIAGDTLERYVLALAHPKVKILLKKPNKKVLTDNDTFTYNRGYKNQRVRVQIGVLDPQKKTTDQSLKDAMPKHVLESRKNRVEAAIVRIMKARKTLAHAQLVSEVVRQLSSRFQPNPQFIKQRISSLIEREYLKRDENDRKQYIYVA